MIQGSRFVIFHQNDRTNHLLSRLKEESRLEGSYPEPLSEISMHVNPSGDMRETPLTHTQVVLNT